ncbi:MAG: chondroitinase-B domain-containing protein [Bacteroidota bacterium]
MEKTILLCFLALLFLAPLQATTYNISDADDLDDLNLVAGDTVIWADGDYRNQDIRFNAFGTVEAPITLRAATPGGVVFSGDSPVTLYGTHLIMDGFVWRGAEGNNNQLQFRRSGSNADFCTDCVLRNCTFDDLVTEAPDKSRWVVLYGQRNVVEHCTFMNKHSTGALILVELLYQGSTTADHVIRDNYFYNVTPKDDFMANTNDSEVIRIGASRYQAVDARVTVAHNYFQATDGENEIISNKSAGNRYLNNTFRASRGSLVMRHGARARVEGNYFLGEGKLKSGGVRISDRDHVIVNNYLSGLNNPGDRWNNAITIVAGRETSGGTSNGYQSVDNILVAFNTIYNADDPIFFNDRDNDVSSGTIAYNLVYSTNGQIVAGDFGDTGSGMTYVGNVFGGSSIGITDAGITVGEENFVVDGEVAVPVTGGLSDGAASEAYASEVLLDNFGRTRPATSRDVGAHEVSGASGAATNAPITNADVGNGVGASYTDATGHSGAAPSLTITSPDVFDAAGSAQEITVSGNVNWIATSTESWVMLTPASGANSGVITVTLAPNDTGAARTAIVTIASADLTREVAIRQKGALSPSNCTDTNNVALEGGVVAFTAEQNTDNAAANVIDDISDNRWSAEGFPQSVTIDLGDAYRLGGISVIPHQGRDYQFLLEGSDTQDGTYTTIVDATDNTDGGNAISRDFAEQTARFVRFTVTGAATYDGPWVSISEVQLFCSGNSVNTRDLDAGVASLIKLYPVPAHDVLNIENVPEAFNHYILSDISGRQVQRGRFNGRTVDLSAVRTRGLVLISFVDGGGRLLTRRVVLR